MYQGLFYSRETTLRRMLLVTHSSKMVILKLFAGTSNLHSFMLIKVRLVKCMHYFRYVECMYDSWITSVKLLCGNRQWEYVRWFIFPPDSLELAGLIGGILRGPFDGRDGCYVNLSVPGTSDQPACHSCAVCHTACHLFDKTDTMDNSGKVVIVHYDTRVDFNGSVKTE